MSNEAEDQLSPPADVEPDEVAPDDVETAGVSRWAAPVVAVVALVFVGVVMSLWLDARDDVAAAIAERDEARGAASSGATPDAEVEELRSELDDALDELEEAEAAPEVAPDDVDATGDLETALADIERLEDEKAELEEQLRQTLDELRGVTVGDAPAGADPAGDADATSTTVPGITDSTVDDGTDSPFLEVGTTLAGLYRQNVLDPGQRTCLGEFTVLRLGIDLLPILGSDDPGSNEQLIQTLEDAAPACRITPSAIFG